MQVVVIGGGPGGAVTAAALARRGHAVDLFEAEAFPRFHVGESLLPCSLPLLERIGIDATWWDEHPFQRKHGATFERPDGSAAARFDFGDALPGDPDHAWQVERAVFDHALLEHARAQGVRIHQPRRVASVDANAERPVVVTDDGAHQRADLVVDASGRDTLLARAERLRDTEGDLRRAAVYGHVPGLALPEAAHPGDVCIVMSSDGWAWQIPLACGRVSVGLVLERSALRAGGGPEAVFRANLERFPALARRLAGRVPDPVRSTPDISYRVRRRHGPGWALVGDSGGFLDPIFSSGIHLAIRQGLELAAAVDAGGPAADLAVWDADCAHDLRVFAAFIRLWYQHRTLANLLFAPRGDTAIARGITSVLAGNTRADDNPFLAMLLRRGELSAR